MVLFTKKDFLIMFALSIITVFLFYYFSGTTFENLGVEPFYQENGFAEVYFCPRDYCARRLISHIDSAEKSLFVAIYSFSHMGIAEALVSARDRGVEVKVVMDFLQAQPSYSVKDFFQEELLNFRIKKGAGAMHHKFVIIDSEKVFTGSFNYSMNADTRNNENLVLLNDERMAQKYYSEFFLLWEESE